jgi:hypothetical protein
MIHVKEHLKLLGLPVKDRVTGCTGIVASIGFDLYGCIQAIVNPGKDKDGKLQESIWFDVARLEVTDTTPVMAPPNFKFGKQAEGRQGPADKPAFTKF